jgi:MFS family permease
MNRRIVLMICSLSLLLVGLDATIVNVALPAVQRSFHTSVAGLQWTVDAYTLVLASLLLLAGSTADRLGRRRVLQAGLVLFSVASLLCALAPDLELLVAFRVLQAIGVFPAMFGISIALGPILGGLLVSTFSWRATFLVSVPIGLGAVALAARFVPESRAARPRRVDPVGHALVTAGLAAIIEGGASASGTTRSWSPLRSR